MTYDVVIRIARRAACLLLVAAVVGCTGGTKNKSPVKGKVVANGQPVTQGSITFMPMAAAMAAMPAAGEIKSDGTFVLTTDKEGDGAAIGKHRVSFTPPSVDQPEWDGYGTQPPQKEVPYAGFAVKENEVEVKSGGNDLTIELVKGGGS